MNVIQIYTRTLSFVKDKFQSFECTWMYKAKQFMLAEKYFQEKLHILEDAASSVQIDLLNMRLFEFF